MLVDITKQEAWKILDAIQSYSKDYTVSGAVSKTFDNVTKKLKNIINDKVTK
jgi:hypothetical protein